MRPDGRALPLALLASLWIGTPPLAQEPASAPPPDTRSRIDAAVAAAQGRDKRILVAWSESAAVADSIARAAAGTKVRGQPLRYEFEVVAVDASRPENAAMAAVYRAGGARPWMTVLDGTGRPIAQQDASGWMKSAGIDVDALTAFLEAHRVPMPDAADVLAEGLARAKATNRNVLVHLAAPW